MISIYLGSPQLDVVTLIEKGAPLVLAAVAGIYTALQYERAKAWRAGDLAAGLVSQLQTDDELAFACNAIDWGVGTLVAPVRYRALLGARQTVAELATGTERGETIEHDVPLMARALRVNLSFDPGAEPAGLVYRYCFDRLFDHFANVNRLLTARQVRLKDLQGLRYWLERIAVYEYPPPGVARAEVFQPFLRHRAFGYAGVIDLGKALGVNTWMAMAVGEDASSANTG